jgi:DNA-binding transcriptional LysR family regulator
VPLARRLLIDDMLSLKQAAIGGLGVVALPDYVCRDDVKSGALLRVLPGWIAGVRSSRGLRHGPRLSTSPNLWTQSRIRIETIGNT